MSIERFFVRTVTIVRPIQPTAYGETLDYDNGTTVTTKGWLHQLSELEQATATRDGEISTHVLRVPTETVIDADDQVTIDGQTFMVDGPPAHAWRPGGEHHIRVPLRYSDG